MRHLCWLIILAPLAIVQTAFPASHSARVKVIVSSTFGMPLPEAKLTLIGIYSGEKFTAVGAEANFHRVPFGMYDLEVSEPGFVDRKERVGVEQRNIVFRTGLELGAIRSEERSALSGSIRPGVDGRKDLWVRLMALYSSDLIENSVDRSGKFELDGMAAGKYLLLVLEKDKVLATKRVDILGGKQTVELTLQ